MTLQYPQLTYAGDVTGSEQAQPGHLLGCDEVGRFYEVVDLEFVPETYPDDDWSDGVALHPNCTLCGRLYAHTHVNLQYATAESMKRAAAGQSVEG